MPIESTPNEGYTGDEPFMMGGMHPESCDQDLREPHFEEDCTDNEPFVDGGNDHRGDEPFVRGAVYPNPPQIHPGYTQDSDGYSGGDHNESKECPYTNAEDVDEEPVSEDVDEEPVSIQTTCKDNKIVLECLEQYAKMGETIFWGHLAKALGQNNPDESKERKKRRAFIIQDVRGCLVEYSKYAIEIHDLIEHIHMDASVAQTERVQDLFLNFLMGGLWAEEYATRTLCGFDYINSETSPGEDASSTNTDDPSYMHYLKDCYIPTDDAMHTHVQRVVEQQMEQMHMG